MIHPRCFFKSSFTFLNCDIPILVSNSGVYKSVLVECLVVPLVLQVRKALSSHGHGSGGGKPVLTEAALLAAVNLCKASTYININDRNNILFILVHSVYADLQVKPNAFSIRLFCIFFPPRKRYFYVMVLHKIAKSTDLLYKSRIVCTAAFDRNSY